MSDLFNMREIVENLHFSNSSRVTASHQSHSLREVDPRAHVVRMCINLFFFSSKNKNIKKKKNQHGQYLGGTSSSLHGMIVMRPVTKLVFVTGSFSSSCHTYPLIRSTGRTPSRLTRPPHEYPLRISSMIDTFEDTSRWERMTRSCIVLLLSVYLLRAARQWHSIHKTGTVRFYDKGTIGTRQLWSSDVV